MYPDVLYYPSHVEKKKKRKKNKLVFYIAELKLFSAFLIASLSLSCFAARTL